MTPKMILQNLSNPQSIVRHYSSEHKIQIIKEASTNQLAPMELIKQYMLEEIKSIHETRQTLKKQYPELFALYAC